MAAAVRATHKGKEWSSGELEHLRNRVAYLMAEKGYINMPELSAEFGRTDASLASKMESAGIYHKVYHPRKNGSRHENDRLKAGMTLPLHANGKEVDYERMS